MEEDRCMVEVVGLPADARWEDVHQFFSNCGSVRNLEIFRTTVDTSNALVTFVDPYSVDIALCLSGSEFAGQQVTVLSCGTHHVDPSPHLLNFHEAGRNSLAMHSDHFVSSPGEAVTVVQQAVQTMISKGYVLSKDALSKAKAFDESHQVSSTAAAKMFELSKKIVPTTMSVASYTSKTAVSAATAVVNSSYFAKGALMVADALDRAAKATAKLGHQEVEK